MTANQTRTRTCRRCDRTRTTPEEIQANGVPTCRACALEHRRQHDREALRKKRATPEGKARSNAAIVKWRTLHRQDYLAAQARYRERLKHDPERHQRSLETHRIGIRLRRERAGRPIAPLTREQYLKRYGNGSGGNGVVLPAGPLRELIKRWLPSEGDRTTKQLAELADVSERRIYGLLHHEQDGISLRLADNVCAVLGVPFALLYPLEDA